MRSSYSWIAVSAQPPAPLSGNSFESLNQVGLSDSAVETFTLAPLIVLRSGVTTTGTILAAVALAPGVSPASGCAAPSESSSRPRFQLMLESDEIATNNPKDDPPRPYAIIDACSSLMITTQSVPNGTVEVAYSTPPFEATGGKTPYTWSISAGALPAGLTQSSTTGAITGTPSAAGPFNFTVRVTDSTTPPQMATRAYSGMINSPPSRPPGPPPPSQPPPPTITTESVPNGTVGVAYSAPFAATGGTAPYTWSISAGAPPAGLTQNPTTGAVTGTPSAAGPFNFTVRVTDSTTPSPQMATRSYSGMISPSALTITTESVPTEPLG